MKLVKTRLAHIPGKAAIMATEAAAALFNNLRYDLQNDASAKRMFYARGYIDALKDAGLIAGPVRDGWIELIKNCPGDHGGGRAWCAYCGEIPREEVDEEEL